MGIFKNLFGDSKKQPEDKYVTISSYAFPHKNRRIFLSNIQFKLHLEKKKKNVSKNNNFIIKRSTNIEDKKLDKNSNASEINNLKARFEKDFLRFFNYWL